MSLNYQTEYVFTYKLDTRKDISLFVISQSFEYLGKKHI